MPAAPEDRLGLQIKRAEQAMIAAKTRALRPLGLTVPQYSALLFLDAEPGLSSAALARLALVTPQSMGPVLNGLEERSLIERRPHRHHRRLLEYFLTKDGTALLRRADRAAVRVEEQLAAGINASDRARLRRLLDRVVDNLADDAGSAVA